MSHWNFQLGIEAMQLLMSRTVYDEPTLVVLVDCLFEAADPILGQNGLIEKNNPQGWYWTPAVLAFPEDLTIEGKV